jgi:hypothetical protein
MSSQSFFIIIPIIRLAPSLAPTADKSKQPAKNKPALPRGSFLRIA